MLYDFLKDYATILIFLFISIGIGVGFIFLNLLFSPNNPDSEKLSAYECGFEFIIFVLEVAFLFPWAVSLGNIGLLGFWSMMFFLLILTVGFVYEWKKGALDWE